MRNKTSTMKTPTGYTIYDGPSNINGDNIIVVITLSSTNIKTGNMGSMWILHKDLKPTEASKAGKDESVCGQCVHRHFKAGACYVTLHHAPLQVWKSFHRGNYPMVEDMSKFEGMSIRFGAYGDPYAIPFDILAQLKSVVKNNTSYTHQWQANTDSVLKTVSMASVDSISEAKEAQSKGWRTFRVTNDLDTLLANEIICPNTTKGIQCVDCGLCSGTASSAKSIVIQAHGSKKKKFTEA